MGLSEIKICPKETPQKKYERDLFTKSHQFRRTQRGYKEQQKQHRKPGVASEETQSFTRTATGTETKLEMQSRYRRTR